MPTADQWTSASWPSTSDVRPMGSAQTDGIAQQIIPTNILARASGLAQPQNISRVTNDFDKIQAYIRAAENGDMTMLYALWRDLLCGDGHIQSELAKRKMVVSGQPWTVVAADKENAADVQAADAIKWMINHCDNWDDGMNHLLDATVMAKVAAEKIFEPYQPRPSDKLPIRFRLKRFFPVDYTLYTYQVAYIPQGQLGYIPNTPFVPAPRPKDVLLSSFQNPAMIYNPDEWQADLRFFSVFPQTGMVNRSWSAMYAPDPDRHIIHEASLFPGVRDNYGLSMRPLVFWWFLSIQGRDWFARFMERWGSPFLKGKVDTADSNAVNAISTAFSNATKLSGIIVDQNSEVEIEQAMSTNGAQSYELFLNFCNKEKSKLILGHADASETSKGDGLKKGTGDQVHALGAAFQQYDKKMLQNTLRNQVFRQFLDINGFAGETPEIRWGGEDMAAMSAKAETLSKLKTAGLRPSEKSLDKLSEEFGIELEYQPEPTVENGNPNKKPAATK